MLGKMMGKIFDKKSDPKELAKYPKIEDLFKTAESQPAPLPKNEIPASLENLYRSLKTDMEISGKKSISMREIEEWSPLYAHQIKSDILAGLIELGFDEKKLLEKHHIRYGKKLSEHYYFLNLKPQRPLPTNVKAVIEEDINQINNSELSKVDFASLIKMDKQEVLITYELILGHLDLVR